MGGHLSFAEWITKEKENFLNWNSSTAITNKPLSDSINNVLDKIHRDAGYKEKVENKYILGINKNILIAAGVLIVAGTVYFIYKKSK